MSATAYYILIVVVILAVGYFLKSMGQHSTSLRRGAIIWSSIIGGAIAGLVGGFTYFRITDPHPSPASGAAMGEGLLVVYVLAPACAVVAGLIASNVTKDRQ